MRLVNFFLVLDAGRGPEVEFKWLIILKYNFEITS